jgi:hypothetical protein
MKYADFERKMRGLMDAPMAAMGFSWRSGPYFTRARHEWLDVIFFDLDRASTDAFTANVGIHLPSIAQRLARITPGDIPAPIVSEYLGRLEDDGRGSQTWYRFGRSVPLATAVDQMVLDLKKQGVPWLSRFGTLEDIAAEYRRRRVIDVKTGEPKLDPVAWSVYGFILMESGSREEGTRWISKARDQLTKPMYTVDGRRFLFEPVPGAKPIPRPPQEQALVSVLAQALDVDKP